MGRLALLGIVVLAFGSSGCAFMFRGSKQTVELDAIPKGADVRNGGELLGTTPVQAELARDRDASLIVSKDGYVPGRLQLQRRPNTAWFIWDIATCVIPITLCIPVLADGISGAWFGFEDAYVVKLPPEGQSAAPPRGNLPEAAPPPETRSPSGY